MTPTTEVGGRGRALVVDDDSEVRLVLGELFRSIGWDADLATDGREALALYSEENYDLVTLDVRMPGMNGEELLTVLSDAFGAGKRITHRRPATLPPIVLVTGADEPERLQALLFKEGVIGILRKPASAAALRRLAEDALQWRRRREQQQADLLLSWKAPSSPGRDD